MADIQIEIQGQDAVAATMEPCCPVSEGIEAEGDHKGVLLVRLGKGHKCQGQLNNLTKSKFRPDEFLCNYKYCCFISTQIVPNIPAKNTF